MKTIILDTETSGLPITKKFGQYYHPSLLNYYDSSRIIEIGYIVFFSNKELFRRSFIIKPNGFTITNENIHGITNKFATEKGHNIVDILKILECDLCDVNTIVCHNVNFDLNVLLSECYRHNSLKLVEKLQNLTKECTMLMGQKFLKQKKYPSLKFLYTHLNNTNNNLKCHRALDDTIMCADCYFKIKKLN